MEITFKKLFRENTCFSPQSFLWFYVYIIIIMNFVYCFFSLRIIYVFLHIILNIILNEGITDH